jgi:hypothetical protein
MRAADILPGHRNEATLNGIMIRKGTVGAFIANARVWLDPLTPANERAAAENDIVDALPALRALGLFDLLEIRDPGCGHWSARTSLFSAHEGDKFPLVMAQDQLRIAGRLCIRGCKGGHEPHAAIRAIADRRLKCHPLRVFR